VTDILMPALSPTMEDGVLSKWNVKEGDKVSAGDVIAEIETDKATMEVEAVDEGVVDAILVPAGTEGVKVNTPIARLKGEGEIAPTLTAKTEAQSPRPSEVTAASAPETPELGGNTTSAAAKTSPSPKTLREEPQDRVFASPLARRMAEQKGVDLAIVKGTGPHGRVVKADIEAAQPSDAPAARPQTTAEPRQVQSLEQMGIPAGSYDLVPLDGMSKTIAFPPHHRS
jgi:pyruvate dehydrogenase E2 component (dihydrolipoamide acetyltransferase)